MKTGNPPVLARLARIFCSGHQSESGFPCLYSSVTRSADLQPAVLPICNRQTVGFGYGGSRLLLGPQNGIRRSEPVLGCSKAQTANLNRISRSRFTVVRCCARGRAYCGFVVCSLFAVFVSVTALALSGCSRSVGPRALVVAQAPVTSAASSPAHDMLDLRYPAGSRLVLADAPVDQKHFHVLSRGLVAAGGPVVSYDGRLVIFSGKKLPKDAWQVYEVRLPRGAPHAITTIRGGAMQPALLPDGSVVFASPVPNSVRLSDSGGARVPQLYVQSSGATPRQLTFGPAGATDPCVLSDGRILFVSSVAYGTPGSQTGQALYTINNDGTELTPFACQHEALSIIERPCQLPNGRVAFLARSVQNSGVLRQTFEFVRLARPFFGREQLFPDTSCRVRSVQPTSNDALLVCAESSTATPSAHSSNAVFYVPGCGMAHTRFGAISTDAEKGKVGVQGPDFAKPLFADANWNMLEAAEALPHPRPMGRLSSMDPAKRTGQILCLNVNDTTIGRTTNGAGPSAKTVRVLAAAPEGAIRVLGEVPVQADGSFMAEVPSDVPLGFEALDENNQVLRRVAPIVWVRPGENRSCIGCHEPHSRSPHNHRPLAVRAPVPCLRGSGPDALISSGT